MSYDNAVRAAIRTHKNPTNVPVHVGELPNGDILLHVNNDKVMRLPKVTRALFAGYLNELVNLIEAEAKVRCSVYLHKGPESG